ncbi:MAG: sigma-70 family RNA polymerase sigma factor [Ekhidna sp.]
MTDLVRIRKGDRGIIESIYDECFPSIANWIRKNSGTEKEAEDTFQDALVVLFQKSKDPEFEIHCKLSTYVFGVAKKMWLHKLRTRNRHVFTDFTAEEEISPKDDVEVDKLVIDAEIDQVYKRNFAKLTEECRKILTHFFNGLSMKEIVNLMEFKSDGLARKRKFNCKNELIKLVKADPLYDELIEKEI